MDNVRLYCLSDISSPVDENIAYYLQNVETGKYLNQGNDWGTHAVLADEGLPVKVTRQDDGSYTFYFLEGSTNEHLLFCFDDSDEEVYVDYNSESDRQNPYWIISDAETVGTYRIQSISNSESMYLGNNPTKEAYDHYGNALGVYNDVDANILNAEGMNITWRFVKVEEEDPEENYLTIADTEGFIGRKVIVNVEMTNTESITALQFDLTLPAGVTIAKNSKGKYIVENTSRCADHTLSASKPGDANTYKVLLYSNDVDVITGNSGTVVNVKLEVSDEMETGDYDVTISNIKLTRVDEVKITPASVTCTLTISNSNSIPGDANGDGDIDVTDIVTIANYILGRASGTMDLAGADANEDGEIDVTDIVTVANIILHGGNNQNNAKMRADAQLLDPQ